MAEEDLSGVRERLSSETRMSATREDGSEVFVFETEEGHAGVEITDDGEMNYCGDPAAQDLLKQEYGSMDYGGQETMAAVGHEGPHGVSTQDVYERGDQ